MNKRLTFFASAIAVAMLTACGGGQTTTKEEKTAEPAAPVAATYTVDAAASTVTWSGEVAGVYGHKGLISVKEGSIVATGDQITGGTVVIDMTTIIPTDSASYKDEDGRRATDLVGHLSTGDFFLVEEFPTATYEIKSQTGNELVGDLTVRGITKEVKATLTSSTTTAEGFSGTADLVFNRQDFEVSWVHFMKDMILSDDIKVSLDIKAKS